MGLSRLKKGLLYALIAGSLLSGCSEDEKPTGPAQTKPPVPTQKNRPPIITSSPITSVNENQIYSYRVEASDPDGDGLNYFLTKKPSWLSISGSGFVNGIPPEVASDQSLDIEMIVSDGKDSTRQNYPLTVKNVSNSYVLSASQLAGATVNESSVSLAQQMDFAAGDIIGAGITQQTPDGFLRRITSVSSDKKTFQTEQASLEETVKNGDFSFQGKIPSSGILSSNIENVVIYDFDGNPSTTEDRLKASGYASFSLDYNLTGKVTNMSLEKLIFSLTATGKYDIKINSQGSFGFFSKNIDIKEFPFPPVIIGYAPAGLPIIVRPKVVFSVGFSGGIKVIETRVSQEAAFTVGLAYEKGQWKPIINLDNKFQFDPLVLVYPNLTFEAHAGPTIKFPLYNVAGPKGSLFGNLEFNANASKWTLSGGLEGILGVEMKIFKKSLADFNSKVIDYQIPLAEGQITPPPQTSNGKIFFVSIRNSDAEIYSINPDGSQETNLTNHSSGWDIHPSLSPDGKKILYSSRISSSSDYDIYMMDADGSNKIKLTSSSMDDSDPVFSPDGTKIAYSAGYLAGGRQIYVMNQNEPSSVNITNDYSHYYWDLSWTPGQKIAFHSNRDNFTGEVYSMNPNGSEIKKLTNTSSYDRSPSWSPDGAKIVFTSGRDGDEEIYLMNSDGSNQTNLSRSPNTNDSNPSWSPDGKKIIYSSGNKGSQFSTNELWIMNSDGSGKIKITNNNYNDSNPVWGKK